MRKTRKATRQVTHDAAKLQELLPEVVIQSDADNTRGQPGDPIVGHINRMRKFLADKRVVGGRFGASQAAENHPLYAEFIKNAKTLETQRKMAPDMLAVNAFVSGKKQQMLLDRTENLDIEGKLPVFLSNAAMFKDIMAAGLPPLAKKIQTFLQATPVRAETRNGPVNILPAEVDMTPDQVKMALKLTDKFIPAQLPMDMAGQQQQANQTKIEVGITQVGTTPDYGTLPGEVNGIPSGATVPQQNTTVTFRTVGPDGAINEMQVGVAPVNPGNGTPTPVYDVTPPYTHHETKSGEASGDVAESQ